MSANMLKMNDADLELDIPEKPKQRIVYYQVAELSHFSKMAIKRLSKSKNKIENQHIPKHNRALVLANISDVVEGSIKDIETFGEYGTLQSFKIRCLDLEVIKRKCTNKNDVIFYTQILTTYNVVKKILSRHASTHKEYDQIYKLSTPKILKLIEIVKEHKPDPDKRFFWKGVIFVERRYTANVLYFIFRNLAKIDENFKFVMPEFVANIPPKRKSQTAEELLQLRWTKQAFLRFRLSQANLLMFSGGVQGVKMPKCSLVIRFDENVGDISKYGDIISLVQEDKRVEQVGNLLSEMSLMK